MSANFTGSWQTRLPQQLRIQIDQSENHLREEMIVSRQDGPEVRIVFTCSTGCDGHGTLNGQPIRAKANWVGSELLVESWMPFGEDQHFRDFWSLTEDGQTLVMEHRDDPLAGQVTVLERVE